MVIVLYPFGTKRTGEAVREQILKNKKYLEEHNKPFPFNRVIHVSTIIKWINLFNWEEHRLESLYEDSLTIDDDVNEFNQLQIRRKTKRVNILNNALDALLNINIKLSMKLASIPPQNGDGSVSNEYKELTDIITSIGYLYKTLETLHETQTIAVNTFKGYVNEWQDVKDRIKPHHNESTTNEENLEGNIETINYFFENYVNTE